MLQLRPSAANSTPEPPPPDDVPLWSQTTLEQLRGLAGERTSVATEIMELYRTDSLRIVAALHAAIVARDREAIAQQAHALLGISRTVGAERVAALTRALEDAAKRDDAAVTPRLFGALVEVVEQTHRAMAAAYAQP